VRKKQISIILSILLLLSIDSNQAFSAISLLNKSCSAINTTTVSAGKKLICINKSGKKVWAISTKSNSKSVDAPTLIPNFNLKMTSNLLYATLIVPAREVINKESIKTANVILYSKINGNYIKVADKTVENVNLAFGEFGGSTNIIWEIPKSYYGSEMAVEIRYVNESGEGEKSLKSFPLPTPEPSASTSPIPTSTPTSTPTPSANPSPVTSAQPSAEVGCVVNYLNPLPFASQKIAIINMNWEKDAQDYVSAVASIRNDNSMALRLVEFTFYLMHKGSVITTQSTLQGNFFFIQDDSKFNSLDGVAGAWLPGQVRTFKIPTNQMLECKSINLLSSGFNVRQGIGAN
jgi:hypothetical protein